MATKPREVRVKKASKYQLVYLVLRPDYTDLELRLLMLQANMHRKILPNPVIVCCVDGYDDDPRELHEVPEVVALCGRLFSTGLVAEIEECIYTHPVAEAAKGKRIPLPFCAFQVWMIREGIYPKPGKFSVTEDLCARFLAALREAQTVSGTVPDPRQN